MNLRFHPWLIVLLIGGSLVLGFTIAGLGERALAIWIAVLGGSLGVLAVVLVLYPPRKKD